MSNTRIVQRKRTIPHDERYDMHCSEGAWDVTSVLVTAFGNQPEAFASDFGDDQSGYLCFR